MGMASIENLLREAMGLDSESIGRNTIERIVKQRIETVGAASVEDYFRIVTRDSLELQELIDSAAVPETWFFRDSEPFSLLVDIVLKNWYPSSQNKILRILSIPCATGEEPYSIAMSLKDIGFNSKNVRVDAVDISQRVLASARRAIYGPNSFRGDEGNFRSRFFVKTDDGYTLNDSIKKMVNIQHGNLLDEKFLSGSNLYDIVFCRNLLIYFRREEQETAIRKLHRILADNGILFVGHAESGRLPSSFFASMKQAGTFAFRKLASTDAPAEVVQITPAKRSSNHQTTLSLNAPSKRATARPDYKGNKAFSHPHVSPMSNHDSLAIKLKISTELDEFNGSDPVLDEIKRLADKGDLSEAAEFCEKYISENSVSSEGYYLLGLIRQAEGKDAFAGELFRKAVYLNPRHYQALIHLAVQAESAGNLAAAAVYRSRASRVVEKDE